jgi:preprotein translocase subunit YajC
MIMLTYATPGMIQLAMSGGGGGEGTGLVQLVLMMAIIFGIFYFLVIRPQKQQQQEHQSMIESLETGDEIVTAGGIHGEVTDVDEETVQLRINDDTVITLNKNGVSEKKGEDDGDES